MTFWSSTRMTQPQEALQQSRRSLPSTPNLLNLRRKTLTMGLCDTWNIGLLFPQMGIWGCNITTKIPIELGKGRKPPLKNVIHHSSFTPYGYQFGRLVGAMHRIVNSSIGHHNITQGCIVMLDELIHHMQFPHALIRHAIQHMVATVPKHQSAWKALAIYYSHT